MSIVLLVMTDGRRSCLDQAISAAGTNLDGPITRRIIHDDSGDSDYRDWLMGQFGDQFEIVGATSRRGFGAAIRTAWSLLLAPPGPERFVFHLEDDFIVERPVDLVTMAHTLACRPYLVQLALRRQPWNDEERAAGGIVESHPDDFVEETNGSLTSWLEHRRFFTTNPSLYRLSLCRRGWPDEEHSEGVFTHRLLADPELRFGFWGARDSGEWVTHIGTERVGVGY